MSPGSLFFGSVLMLYFLASVGYHVHLSAGGSRARLAAVSLLAIGVAVHTAAIGYRCVTEPRLFADPGTVASLAAYFLAIAQLAVDLGLKWTASGAVAAPVAFVAQFYDLLRTPDSVVQPTVLPNEMLNPHVMATILGFAGFALAFSLAVLYLIQSRLLKRKQLTGIFPQLPPLASIGRGAHWFAVAGMSMLTLGIVTGVMVAGQRWTADWYLDPRVLTTALTWVVYAVYLTVSSLGGLRGQKSTYFLIAGFVAVLIAYFGISVLAPGGPHPL